MEIELKLGVSTQTLDRVARTLARRTGDRGDRVRLTAHYFDTAERVLQANGMAVRVRREGNRWVQAAKHGRTVASGLHRVLETEAIVSGPRPVPQRLPADMAALVAGAALEPVARTRVWRRRWTVPAEGGIVEVSLDRGDAGAGRRSAPITEIEFELKGGSPAALYDLAAELLASEPVRADLPNKAAQAFALLAPEAPARAIGSKPRQPAPGQGAAEAFSDALADLATSLMAALHETFTSDSPQGPHQLRVALRRLRVLLRLYRPILNQAAADELAGKARDLGRLLSPLRDADVLVPAFADRMETGESMGPWHAGLRADTRVALQAAGATAFGLHLLRWSALGGWGHPEGRAAGRTAGQLASQRLDRLWRRAACLGDRLAGLDEEAQHGFRKDLKKVRYTLEFAPVLEKGKPWLRALKSLQESLGLLNDLVALERFQPPLAPAQREQLDQVRAAMLRDSRHRADLALGRTVRAWRQLKGLPLPWREAEQPNGQGARSR